MAWDARRLLMRLLRAMANTTISAATPICRPLASTNGASMTCQLTSTTPSTDRNSRAWPPRYQRAGTKPRRMVTTAATVASSAPALARSSFSVWAMPKRPARPSRAVPTASTATACTSRSSQGTWRVSRKLRANSVPSSSQRLGSTTLPRSGHQGPPLHR